MVVKRTKHNRLQVLVKVLHIRTRRPPSKPRSFRHQNDDRRSFHQTTESVTWNREGGGEVDKQIGKSPTLPNRNSPLLPDRDDQVGNQVPVTGSTVTSSGQGQSLQCDGEDQETGVGSKRSVEEVKDNDRW